MSFVDDPGSTYAGYIVAVVLLTITSFVVTVALAIYKLRQRKVCDKDNVNWLLT